MSRAERLVETGLLLANFDRLHHVTLLDGEDYVHAAGDFAEDGVAGGAADFAGFQLTVDVGVEMWSFGVGYEELGGVGVEAGVGHREHAGGVVLHVGVEDVGELVDLLAVGVDAALDHEAGDYAVPLGVGVEAVVGEVDEVFDVDAGDVVVEVGLDIAFVGIDGDGV